MGRNFVRAANQYIVTATYAGIQPVAADLFTWGCWVKFAATGNTHYLLDLQQNTANELVWWLRKNTSDQLQFTRAKQSVSADIVTDAVAISTGVWYSIVCTYDGTNLHVYKNGVEVSGSPVAATISSPTQTLGGMNTARLYNNTDWLDGVMAETFICIGSAWNINQVKSFAAGFLPSRIDPLNLKFYEPLQGISSPEANIAPITTKNNGTVTGATATSHAPVTRYLQRSTRFPHTILDTKFYLRNVTSANAPTAGEKSTVLPVDTLGANNASGTDETRSLLEAKGSAQISIAKSSDGTTAARDNYLARFTSDKLGVQTLGAGTWQIAIALSETNANANSFLNLSLYIWRPSTSSVVGFIYDSHTNIGAEWNTTEDGQVITFTGSDVSVQDGDVLVLEVWRHAVQGMGAVYAQTLYFEGATDVIDSTTTDAASYLKVPKKVIFQIVAGGSAEPSLNSTRMILIGVGA